ncbi:MAG: hypothetical protein IJ026_02625 [Candidatus Methanomethylophilaceae archaeon]|nr:hypothetical protein [Candidatus Methanomethylophilaceae archaeon]
MIITRFNRINTVIIPGMYLSVVHLADGDGPGESSIEVANTLRSDRDSLDAFAIVSDDHAPESIPGIHRLISDIKPRTLECILVTDGVSPGPLDDLVGSGYVDSVMFTVRGPMAEGLHGCMDLMRRYNYDFSISVDLVPDIFTPESLRALAEAAHGCRDMVLRRMDSGAGIRSFKKDELRSLTDAVRGTARNLRLV